MHIAFGTHILCFCFQCIFYKNRKIFEIIPKISFVLNLISFTLFFSFSLRQWREEGSCHARFSSGYKDSFQTGSIRHAPSSLSQPQWTPTCCLLFHSMYVLHTNAQFTSQKRVASPAVRDVLRSSRKIGWGKKSNK